MHKAKTTFFSLIKKLDLFGISYSFQLDSQEKYKTFTGGVISILFYLITGVLFIGFGRNMYNRKHPKVSFSSEITNYEKMLLSNRNFTFAFRVEDQLGIQVTNSSILFQEVVFYHHEIQENGVWSLVELEYNQTLLYRKCSEMAETPDKQLNFNISLDNWYCVNFDNRTLGGNWDGNFLYSFDISTRLCTSKSNNNTQANNLQNLNGKSSASAKDSGFECLDPSELRKKFKNDIYGGPNLYFSYLFMESSPVMDNFEKPIQSYLVNNYEYLNMKLFKSSVQIFKTASIDNDKGWLFEEVENANYFSNDYIMKDFSPKDKDDDNLLYSHTVYFGKKRDLYTRSYLKVQELFANVGGFAKLLLMIINFSGFFLQDIAKNLLVLERFEFYEADSGDKNNGSWNNSKDFIRELVGKNSNNVVLNNNFVDKNNEDENKYNNYFEEKKKISGKFDEDFSQNPQTVQPTQHIPFIIKFKAPNNNYQRLISNNKNHSDIKGICKTERNKEQIFSGEISDISNSNIHDISNNSYFNNQNKLNENNWLNDLRINKDIINTENKINHTKQNKKNKDYYPNNDINNNNDSNIIQDINYKTINDNKGKASSNLKDPIESKNNKEEIMFNKVNSEAGNMPREKHKTTKPFQDNNRNTVQININSRIISRNNQREILINLSVIELLTNKCFSICCRKKNAAIKKDKKEKFVNSISNNIKALELAEDPKNISNSIFNNNLAGCNKLNNYIQNEGALSPNKLRKGLKDNDKNDNNVNNNNENVVKSSSQYNTSISKKQFIYDNFPIYQISLNKYFDVFNYLDLINDMNSMKAILLGNKVKLLELIKPQLEFIQKDFDINSAANNNLNEKLNFEYEDKYSNNIIRDGEYSNFIFENLNRMLKEQK